MFVCMCAAVTEAEVRECIHSGARSVEEVGERSFAGTGCGGCHARIEALLGGASVTELCPVRALSRIA